MLKICVLKLHLKFWRYFIRLTEGLDYVEGDLCKGHPVVLHG